MEETGVIILGAGVAGIAMAHTLKYQLGYDDFEVRGVGAGRMLSNGC